MSADAVKLTDTDVEELRKALTCEVIAHKSDEQPMAGLLSGAFNFKINALCDAALRDVRAENNALGRAGGTALRQPSAEPNALADRIITDYKEHYDFQPQGESHMHDCIMGNLAPAAEAMALLAIEAARELRGAANGCAPGQRKNMMSIADRIDALLSAKEKV